MNRNGQVIGKIIADFPALILVFVLMLVFVIYSGFISKGHSDAYSLLEDFIGDYIQFNGKVVTVGEAIEMFCLNESLQQKLKEVLINHFSTYYPGNSFVIASIRPNGVFIPVWYGVFMNQIDEKEPGLSLYNFKKEMGSSTKDKLFCKDSDFYYKLYVKQGVTNG